MGRRDRPVATLERVEAILTNRALYELAALVPDVDRTRGGRPRQYPPYAWLLFDALLSVYGSARQVEAELAHPLVWQFCQTKIRDRFPTDQSQWLPVQPIRRHHYQYARDRYLTDPAIFADLLELHREIAAEQARELGLCDPNGPGSWTHPDLSRMLHADGKVITPLYKAHAGDTTREPRHRRDPRGARRTRCGTALPRRRHHRVGHQVRSRRRPHRTTSTAASSSTSDGSATTAAKHAPRSRASNRSRHCYPAHKASSTTRHSAACITKRCSANLGSCRSTASPPPKPASKRPDAVTAAGKKKARASKPNTSRSPTAAVATSSSTPVAARSASANSPKRATSTTPNSRECAPTAPKTKTVSTAGTTTTDFPDRYGGGTVTVRLHGNDDDTKHKLNRTENVRPIPPTDPDFTRLYPRRNDAESINRSLDDTLWLRRAHSLGHTRQHLNLLGFALMTNGLALHRHKPKSQTVAA